jgi:hypothetical protein
MLTQEQKSSLQWYNKQREKFLDHIVTGDKTRNSYSHFATKNNHGVQAYRLAKTKEIETSFSWQEANGYSFLGQKRYFAGGIHESRSNNHIGIVP